MLNFLLILTTRDQRRLLLTLELLLDHLEHIRTLSANRTCVIHALLGQSFPLLARPIEGADRTIALGGEEAHERFQDETDAPCRLP